MGVSVGQLLSYGDAGTPGNVSDPMVVGFGGWLPFKFLFAGRNLAGENRIYAVNQDGQLLSYGDAGTPGNVSDPMVVGFGGWLPFKFLFAGRNLAGENRIYAVNQDGQLLSYGDAGTPGNVSDPMVVGFGGWLPFKFLFAGRNLAGQDRIYAVNQDGQLLSYGDAGTPGNVSDPMVVGFGGWLPFKFLFAGRNLAGQDRIYAVNQDGQLLSYGDAGTPGNVSDPMVVGFGGWLDFKFLFAGRNLAGQDRIYAVSSRSDPPARPTNLRVTDVSDRRISVAWLDHSDNEDGFRIRYRGKRTGFSDHTGTKSVGRDQVSASLADLRSNYEYTISVVAFNDGGESGSSNEVRATTPIAPETVIVNLTQQGGGVGTYVPYAGKYPPFGTVPAGHVIQIKVPSPGVVPRVGFVKTGHTTEQCGDPNAVVIINAGQTTSPAQMTAIFGVPKPPFSTVSPIGFVACVDGGNLPGFIQIEVTTVSDG